MKSAKPARPGYIYAIAAAVLFGASTPAAKWLLDEASPWLLAGLLYLGSGIGLLLVRSVRNYLTPDRAERAVQGRDWLWLGGATFFGGVLAPVLLMSGLSRSNAATTSLLLNLEGVFNFPDLHHTHAH
jgi:drug/metabolite transporter (DMT)-like permease